MLEILVRNMTDFILHYYIHLFYINTYIMEILNVCLKRCQKLDGGIDQEGDEWRGENKICRTGGRLIVYRTSGGSWLHYCIKDFNIYCVKNIVFVIPSVNTQIKFLNLALFLFHLCLHKLPFSGSKDCHLWNGRKGKGSEGTGHMTKSPCISTFSFQP